jgi:hypothetical protein
MRYFFLKSIPRPFFFHLKQWLYVYSKTLEQESKLLGLYIRKKNTSSNYKIRAQERVAQIKGAQNESVHNEKLEKLGQFRWAERTVQIDRQKKGTRRLRGDQRSMLKWNIMVARLGSVPTGRELANYFVK